MHACVHVYVCVTFDDAPLQILFYTGVARARFPEASIDEIDIPPGLVIAVEIS